MAVKNYVLDTNILISSPRAIYGFEDNTVIITSTTLQELDKKKTSPREVGYGAREVIRIIAANEGDYLKGVRLDNGGLLRIYMDGDLPRKLNDDFFDTPDNRIINGVLNLMQNEKDTETILVTNDISMRINASICGVQVQSYRNEMIEQTETYTGRVIIEDINKTDGILPNAFGILKDGNGSSLYIMKNGVWNIIKDKDFSTSYCFPKNVGQRFALYALLAPPEEIPLVILKGPAGSAKTFLSLAAGLDRYFKEQYENIMITRSNVLSDNDLGFLPGTLEEKMSPLMAPFMDNLKTLLYHHKGKEEREEIHMAIEDLFETGAIEICSIAYMRGRSLNNTFLIIDEAQNCTTGQILEIITRAGEKTKVVLLGDPDQIDNPILDKTNNGLSFASEKMKGSELCAQITFDGKKETVRSPLATEAAGRLTAK